MAKKILIIDDEPELVKAVGIRLKASGYEVELAYDGQAGIDKAKEFKPDLILLDIIMPKMDGYEVCKRLKDNQETEDIPIVILSASQQRNVEAKCIDLGVTEIITKPFETSDLLNIVNGILKQG